MNAFEYGLIGIFVWCVAAPAVAAGLNAWKKPSDPGPDPDVPQHLPFDPFTTFLENEVSVGHLRLRGVGEEELRSVRQDLDASLMALHQQYRALAAAQGFDPQELYGWGTEEFYSATRPT